MTDATVAVRPTLSIQGATLAYATPVTASPATGYRSFFRYGDRGVTAASQVRMRAQVTIAIKGTTEDFQALEVSVPLETGAQSCGKPADMPR